MELSIFFYLLAAFAFINVIYYLFLSKVSFGKTPEPEGNSRQPISIIVCSKNEQKNLKKLVPKLVQQDHPNYEIILINDASHDKTREVIEEFIKIDDRVKMVNVVNNESFWGNKKYALTLGIKKAKHDQLVFIDADCTPKSSKWLSLMGIHFSERKKIVLGYSGYEKIKGSFLNSLIRFETGMTAIQYMSYAMHGNPYMGVGRNLGYTATLFYEQSGFVNHMNVLGGDDDLFINQAATNRNTTVSLNEDSFTTSAPKTTWSSWWQQKRRHINTATHYKKKHQLLLGLFYLSQISFFVLTILAFTLGNNWMFILGIVLLRYSVFWVVVGKGLSRLRESDMIILLPILEIILVCSQLALFISNMAHRPKQWN